MVYGGQNALGFCRKAERVIGGQSGGDRVLLLTLHSKLDSREPFHVRLLLVQQLQAGQNPTSVIENGPGSDPVRDVFVQVEVHAGSAGGEYRLVMVVGAAMRVAERPNGPRRRVGGAQRHARQSRDSSSVSGCLSCFYKILKIVQKLGQDMLAECDCMQIN